MERRKFAFDPTKKLSRTESFGRSDFKSFGGSDAVSESPVSPSPPTDTRPTPGVYANTETA